MKLNYYTGICKFVPYFCSRDEIFRELNLGNLNDFKFIFAEIKGHSF